MIGTKNNTLSIEYNTRLPGFVKGNSQYVASLDGKMRTSSVCCPSCGSRRFVDNGYHRVEDSFVCELGLKINIAQFQCKKCGVRWSTKRDLIDQIIAREKEFLKSLLIGCVRSGLSFARSCTLVQDNVGQTYSPQYLHELYTTALDQIKLERAANASGVYYYDEQFLKENGREICRLAVRDQVTGKVILDKMDVDASESAIKRALLEALDGLPVEAFTVDMAVKYPGIIKDLYPKAVIQWCIFHLYKIIWKELKEAFGKNPPLQQLYNVYLLFDVFFDHTAQLKKLVELLTHFQQLRTNDSKSNLHIENGLRDEFRKFTKAQKKQRRRDGKNVPRRTLDESVRAFDTIKEQAKLFPQKLQHRITLIDKNWNRFTLFQRDARVEPTNNGIEQYFAATLSKTDKKDFRSTGAIRRELRACQAEWNDQQLFSHTPLLEVFGLVGLLFLAFPPG